MLRRKMTEAQAEAYADYVERYVEFVEDRLVEVREDEGVLVDELTGAFFPEIAVYGGPVLRPIWAIEGRTERLEGQP
jgi:hypothetical protein